MASGPWLAAHLSCVLWNPHRGRLTVLWHTDSSVPRQVESSVAAYGLSDSAACGFLGPPPGIKLESLALQGGFLTTGPPGKSKGNAFYVPSLHRSKPLEDSPCPRVNFIPWFPRPEPGPLTSSFQKGASVQEVR